MKANETLAQAQARYLAAAHAVQTGVRFMIEHDPESARVAGSQKHIRVGINSALCSSAAIARLLIAKGLITELEHVIAQADEMERERERYVVECSRVAGLTITLG